MRKSIRLGGAGGARQVCNFHLRPGQAAPERQLEAGQSGWRGRDPDDRPSGARQAGQEACLRAAGRNCCSDMESYQLIRRRVASPPGSSWAQTSWARSRSAPPAGAAVTTGRLFVFGSAGPLGLFQGDNRPARCGPASRRPTLTVKSGAHANRSAGRPICAATHEGAGCNYTLAGRHLAPAVIMKPRGGGRIIACNRIHWRRIVLSLGAREAACFKVGRFFARKSGGGGGSERRSESRRAR